MYEEMTRRATNLIVQWAENDPRKIVDDYRPNLAQRERSMSEAQLFDDDGKVRNKETEKLEGKSEDELQLEAILSSSEMPQPEDGGIDEEALKLAAAVPLPLDEEAPTTWKSRITKPFNSVSLPSMSKPSLSMPSVPSLPSMPAFRIPGRGAQTKTESAGKTAQEDAAQVPLPVEVDPEDVQEAELDSIRRTDSMDSGVEVNVYEVPVAKEEGANKGD